MYIDISRSIGRYEATPPGLKESKGWYIGGLIRRSLRFCLDWARHRYMWTSRPPSLDGDNESVLWY